MGLEYLQVVVHAWKGNYWRWGERVTYYRLLIINSIYLHYTTIWVIGKIPQVFCGLPGSAVQVLVEKYPEHGDLYGEYTALWKIFLSSSIIVAIDRIWDIYLCVWIVHRIMLLCGRTSSSISYDQEWMLIDNCFLLK
jgi:hypothetical protein